MRFSGQRFQVLPGLHAVCRLSAASAVPDWVAGSFVSITRTDDELSIICPAECVPNDVRAERGWRVLKVVGPFSFATTGVLASFATPLADAGLSLLAVATFDTDYVLVKRDGLGDAVGVLVAAGHALDGAA